MKTLILNLPNTVDIDDREARMAIAARWFAKGQLSLGQAANLADVSKLTFMEMLSDYGVSLVNYDPSDLEKDFIHAKSHHR